MLTTKKGLLLTVKSLFIFVLMIGLIFTAGTNEKAFASGGFKDVNSKTDHYDTIMEASKLKFLSGYEDGTFKPYNKMRRSHVVKSLGKYVVQTSGKDIDSYDVRGVEPFDDVPPTYSDQELYQYSLIVKEAGVFTGSNNNLLPNNLITRQQMAKVLVNAFELTDIPSVQSKVTDSDSSEFKEYISTLSKNNVTTVVEFKPKNHLSRGQFATFMIASHYAHTDPPVEEVEEPDWLEEQRKWEERIKKEREANAPVLLVEPVSVEELLPTSLYVPSNKDRLPAMVNVTYSDGSVKEHAVTWNTTGIDFTEAGEHEVSGKVKDTELTTTLPLSLKVLTLIPWRPPVLIMLPPHPDEAEVIHARSLISTLPQKVKDADNGLDASAKWGVADEAVKVVNREYPDYNTSHWQTILNDQWKLIEKRLVDTNKAKNDAAIAISQLRYKLEQVEKVSSIQPIIDHATSKLTAYEKLDKRADVTKMRNDVNKFQKIADDLKIALSAIDEMNLILRNEGGVEPTYALTFPKDTKRMVALWFIPKGEDYVNSAKGTLIRDTSFWSPKNREITFNANIFQGDVLVAKKYDLSMTPKSSVLQTIFPPQVSMSILIED